MYFTSGLQLLYVKTNIHLGLLSYLAQFFLEWKMFRTKVVRKIKTQVLFPVIFFFKSCLLWDNVGKILYGLTGHIIIWLMRIACWKPKATDTLFTNYCLSTANNGCTDAPQYYVIVHCVSCLDLTKTFMSCSLFCADLWIKNGESVACLADVTEFSWRRWTYIPFWDSNDRRMYIGNTGFHFYD